MLASIDSGEEAHCEARRGRHNMVWIGLDDDDDADDLDDALWWLSLKLS